jgi:succinate dehydrogenase/fumarate reductase cytochrome b subunit
VSAVVLLVLLPLKIWSGWAFTGRAPGGSWVVSLHTSAWLDVLLLTALAFHALYGIRTILVESGLARHSRPLFVGATAIAALLALVAIAVTMTGRA